MTVDGETPLTVIEGIGPATADKLAAQGIYFVLDLLRLTPATLHTIVAATHSEVQARGWRLMASLLEIEPMSAQWAEALAAGGIGTVEELSRKDITALGSIFEQAEASGMIPAGPSVDEIGQMKRDATVVFFTGSLMGTVLDAQNAPVSGASVRLGFREAITNSRGRFRLARIPLGPTPPLFVSHDQHQLLMVEAPPVIVDPEAVAARVFHLAPVAPGAASPTVRLSEFRGDSLPPMSGVPVRTETVDPDRLREGDVFMVQKFYKREPDALLVSRFRDYAQGEFIVSTARVPKADLPAGLGVKEHVILAGGAFARIEFGPLKHQLDLALRRFDRLHPSAATQPTATESRARTAQKLEFLEAEGLMGHRPEDP